MRKIISILSFIWIALVTLKPDALEEFFFEVNDSFHEAFVEIFPYLNTYFSFDDLVFLVFLFTLVIEVYYQQGAARLLGLYLRNYDFLEHDQVISLNARSQVGEKVEVDDFVKDICYLEKRGNTWVLILLVVTIILVPGIYLAIRLHQALYLLPFAIVAVVQLVSMLRGAFTVATSDGSSTGYATRKARVAHTIINEIKRLFPDEFTWVSLSGIFSNREVYFHSSHITGVVQVSQFPWGCLFLFLISLVGVYVVFREDPSYALRAGIVPVVLLLLVIFLALQRRLLVKMTGAHYYALGKRSSARAVLAFAAPKPESPPPAVSMQQPVPEPQQVIERFTPEHPATATEPLAVPPSVEPEPVWPFFKPEPVSKVCPSCGKENKPEYLHCMYCGADL